MPEYPTLPDLMRIFFRDSVNEIKEALKNLTEVSVDTGIADATSTVNQLDDAAKSWPVNAFQNLIVEITKGTGAGELKKIATNTATALLPATPFTVAPDVTSEYRIAFYGKMASDITHWGGTAVTGRDVSLDWKALTDDGIKGILKSLGDVGAGDNIVTILAAIQTAIEIIDNWDETNRAAVNLIAGQVGVQGGSGGQNVLTQRVVAATDSPEVTAIGSASDAAVAAGAVGTLSAKLRAISRDLVANIVLATGANAIGKLAANSGVDIGDVNAPVLETLASSVDTTPTQITKTVAAIGTPEALAADGTFFRTATIIGKKAPRIDNVGIVYLGIGAGNDTQPYEITPGETIELSAPPGEKYDLNDWYCDVLNAGDGVIIIYS
jgi:hypothetical protein